MSTAQPAAVPFHKYEKAVAPAIRFVQSFKTAPTTFAQLQQRWNNWLNALESGRYEQARGCLAMKAAYDPQNVAGYCCIGVQADLLAEEGVGEWKPGDSFTKGYTPPEGDWSTTTNTEYPAIMASLFLTQEDSGPLINKNDDQKAPFPDIAAYAREVLMPRALDRFLIVHPESGITA